MIEPTGYTALDLIGFTDRGYYNPSADYVKNDLVHDDNESIWRVLIDETSGVTPTEGLNYTIFIRNPQDAAKQMIAPVETSPTTNAHAAGTQIIYHDVLYDVTTAIAAGGALVVYPTSGYNIKPAPLVTSQIQALSNKAYQTDNAAETNIADGDYFPFYDSSATAKKKTLWSNIKSVLANLFAKRTDLTTINATGSTNTTGATIKAKTSFYLNGVLVKALVDIAQNATFTLNTNYAEFSNGVLNQLQDISENITSTYGTFNFKKGYVYGDIVWIAFELVLTTGTGAGSQLLKGLPKPITNYPTFVFAGGGAFKSGYIDNTVLACSQNTASGTQVNGILVYIKA